jgi:protein-tyrosine-phosphatase
MYLHHASNRGRTLRVTIALIRVLFICTGNAARSQMAEAMLRHLGKDRFEVFSAGTSPQSEIHPLAGRVMGELGIAMDGQAPKPLSRFAEQHFDYVISLCDRARGECGAVPVDEIAHWSFGDPVEGDPDEAAMAKRFHDVMTGLERRIRLLMIVEEGGVH